MIAGIPGAGIAALFYLLCALAMPFVTLYRLATGRHQHPEGWRIVGRQVAIATGIVLVLVVTGYVVGALLEPLAARPVSADADDGERALAGVDRAIAALGLLLALATLAVVLVAVRLLALRESRRGPARPPASDQRPDHAASSRSPSPTD